MDRNEMTWRAGLDAGTSWVQAAPPERFASIVADLACDGEEGIATGDRREALGATELLADVLAEVVPPSMCEGEGEYFRAGVRSGLLLAWKKRHCSITQAKSLAAPGEGSRSRSA